MPFERRQTFLPWTEEDGGNSQQILEILNSPELFNITFTYKDIIETVKDLCVSSAPSPDGLSSFLLKEYINVLVVPLYFIWRTSLDMGLMPEGTIESIITLIFKGGN